MSLTGNPQKLRDIGKNLGNVAQVTRLKIAARVAPAITGLALASFASGEAPTGEPWRPGADGFDVTLVESGSLRAGLRFVAVGARVRAVLGVRYAKYQVGRRRVLPAPGQQMPASWREAAGRISREEIAAHLAQVA